MFFTYKFICMQIETHFHIKSFARRPVLRQRQNRTRKWAIVPLHFPSSFGLGFSPYVEIYACDICCVGVQFSDQFNFALLFLLFFVFSDRCLWSNSQWARISCIRFWLSWTNNLIKYNNLWKHASARALACAEAGRVTKHYTGGLFCLQRRLQGPARLKMSWIESWWFMSAS